MKKITIFSILFLILSLSGKSQALENESDSTSKSKKTFTNSELGINAMLSQSLGVGLGFYLERKRVNEDRTELGLLMAYNQIGYLDLHDELDFRNDHFGSLLVTAKARGDNFFGIYGGIGGGLILAVLGGSYESNGGNGGDQAKVILRPGMLIDLGFHLGSFNMGFKTVIGVSSANYPIRMGGINIGFKLK